MSVTLASAPFHQGVALLERGLVREAFPLLREAFRLDPHDLRVESWYGLCLAQVSRDKRTGIMHCYRALSASRETHPVELVTNLGLAQLAAGHRAQAWKTLKQAALIEPTYERVQVHLRRFGVRRPPVLKWMPREHAVNRMLGRMRHRLSPPSARV